MALASVTIDAGVLAAPTHDETREEVCRYVEAILRWSEHLARPWVAVYMSKRTSEVMFEDDLYPLRDQLTALFTSKGIVEYDVNTVAAVIDHLLQRTPFFEDYFSIRDVLLENVALEPDIRRFCSGTALQSDMVRCVLLMAILRKYCWKSVQNHLSILRTAPAGTVRVRAHIHELEHTRDDLPTWPVPPEYFEGDVLACEDFQGMVKCLDEDAMLLNATDDAGVETAIRTAVFKSRVKNDVTLIWIR